MSCKRRTRKLVSAYLLLAGIVTTVWGQCISVIVAAPPVTALTLAPEGNAYVVGSQLGVTVHDMSHNRVRALATELVHVHDLQFSPDGSQLLAVGGTPAEFGRIELWSWPQAKKIDAKNLGGDVIYRACWSSDGEKFVVAVADGTCQTFDRLKNPPSIYRGHSRSVLAISFESDNDRILSAGMDQTIQLWSSGTLNRQRGLNNHTDSIYDLAQEPNAPPSSSHRQLASVSEDRTLRLWQPSIGRLVRFARLESVPRCVRWIRQDAGAGSLFVGCDDGRVVKFSADGLTVDQTLLSDIRPIHELAVLPDGNQVLVGGERGVQLLTFQASDRVR